MQFSLVFVWWVKSGLDFLHHIWVCMDLHWVSTQMKSFQWQRLYAVSLRSGTFVKVLVELAQPPWWRHNIFDFNNGKVWVLTLFSLLKPLSTYNWLENVAIVAGHESASHEAAGPALGFHSTGGLLFRAAHREIPRRPWSVVCAETWSLFSSYEIESWCSGG
jgi:hypothetical protein